MADKIEYDGIADDRSIRLGSERCFRDYSPSDTVLSLSDDGKAIYSGPVPSFQSLPNDPEADGHPAPSSAAPLSQYALLAAGSRRSSNSSNSSSRTPLGRFRRDEQPHEKLAVQLSAAATVPTSSSTTPPRHYNPPPFLLPGESLLLASDALAQAGDNDAGMGPSAHTPHLHWQRQRHIGDIPLPPHLPRSVLAPPGSESARIAAEELREKTRFMRSPEWETLTSEDQAKYIHEVFLLKRRVRAVELPRESKAVRVRKRQRTSGSSKTDGSGAGSGA